MPDRIMGPARLEAFSDGVIAIIITIMVLDLRVPASHAPAALLDLWPVFLAYVMSYLVIAIYWVNHHELFHLCKRVTNAVLWTNILFLFCLSLIPFATAYMGVNRFTPFSTALYGAVLLLTGLAFLPMRQAVASQLADDPAYRLITRRAAIKNYVSLTLYGTSVPLAFVHPAITLAIAFVVAAIYFLPDAWLGKRKTR
ncbi:MAG TPA: TMEM175 family protein [Xanthobacteraceae bacterium]